MFGSRERERKEKKMEKGGSSGETAAHRLLPKSEVIDRFVQTEAYICSESREITKKKNQDRKVLQGIISEETKKCNKKPRSQKSGEQAVG